MKVIGLMFSDQKLERKKQKLLRELSVGGGGQPSGQNGGEEGERGEPWKMFSPLLSHSAAEATSYYA